jgi:HAD superfamily hydrolase (TIGR01509 family)
MISACIFDCDGLLADTEKLHFQAYRQVLAGHGVSLSRETYEDHWIRCGLGIVPFAEEHALSLDIEAIRREKHDAYDHLVRTTVQPMPGAVELLDRLRGHKALGLASSSYAGALQAVTETLGIDAYFSVIAAKEAVETLKPAPDIFLHTASELGVAPSACVVFEDSEKGVLAARAAGMKCIAVPNEYTRGNDFSQATRVLDSLEAVTLAMLDSLD